MIEMYCVVSGKVQRVAYRAFVQDSAGTLGVVGWVRNLPDGSVELVAQGPSDVLKEFVEYLHEGSLMAKVESVSIDWRSVKRPLDDFSIKHD
ncbi:acylphosphatase [Candidatus Nomurabacteria bacterium]|nr:acylphosphatase [Candidatus Nomurabacteria bacterium]